MRLRDPRLDLSCRDEAGEPLAFAWIQPVAARVRRRGASRLPRGLSGRARRAGAHRDGEDVDVSSSRATFAISEHAGTGDGSATTTWRRCVGLIETRAGEGERRALPGRRPPTSEPPCALCDRARGRARGPTQACRGRGALRRRRSVELVGRDPRPRCRDHDVDSAFASRMREPSPRTASWTSAFAMRLSTT